MKLFAFWRRLRILFGLLVLLFFLILFVGAFHSLLPGAGIQAAPALGRVAAGFGVASIATATVLFGSALLFGRCYCSFLCPLGIGQDVIYAAVRHRRKRRKQPSYRKIRYSVLAAVVLCALAGLILPLALLDPFSFFGRFGNTLFRPAAVRLNQMIWNWTRAESFSPLDYHPWSGLLLAIAVLSFLILIFLVIWRGRLFCNTVCPVGAALGLLARHSIFRLRLHAERCVSCGQCEKICRSGCIDAKKKSLDFERCVMCFDCGAVCQFGAVNFRRGPAAATAQPEAGPVADPARRKFLAAGGAALAAGAAGAWLLRRRHWRSFPAEVPVMPPGAGDLQSFTSRCTGCQLCVAACPGKTLKPADLEYGWSGIGQARLDFTDGKCEFDCTLCSRICPTGALKPVDKTVKHRWRIGIAEYIKERCVVVTDGNDCGACAEHCPTGALQMVEYRDGLRIPELTPELCIGCGGCEYICPVRPKRAFIVHGLPRQELAADPETILKKPTPTSGKPFEFPF